MVSFPAELLLGIYFGLLVGVIPALVSWGVGFGLTQWTDRTVPWPGAALIALFLAGGNAAVVLFVETPGLSVPGPTGFGVSALVIAVLGVSAHEYGRRRAQLFGERESNRKTAEQKQEAKTAEQQPDHQSDSKAQYEQESDEQLSQQSDHEISLEQRSEEQDSQDEAPAFSRLSNRLADDGRHAVSVNGLIPTGVSAGDAVTIITPSTQVRGTVIAAHTEADEADSQADSTTTAGGNGRLTVAVTRTDVEPLVRAPAVKIVVESRETPKSHELVSQIQQAGNELIRRQLSPADSLSGRTVGELAVDEDELTILGVAADGNWQFSPGGERRLSPGDELFVAGSETRIQMLGETQ